MLIHISYDPLCIFRKRVSAFYSLQIVHTSLSTSLDLSSGSQNPLPGCPIPPPPHFCILYMWCIVRHEMVHIQNKNGFSTTMQSVPTTTEFVSLNPAHGELYSIQQNVVNFIRVLRQIVGFPCVLWFPLPLKLTGTI